MTREQAQPFDENAALAELERLRQGIMAARRQRQQKLDEFDAFVQGFRKPAPSPPPAGLPAPERPVAPPREVEISEQAAVEPTAPQTIAEPSDPTVALTSNYLVTQVVAPAGAPAPRRARINKRWAFGIGGGVAVIALGVLATRSGNQAPPPVGAVTSEPASAAPAETPAVAAPEPPTPSPAQQDTHAVVVDLKTLQSVWMRVVVDGEKKSEGMVQGGESLHFGGDDSIVIRVGNGGAVIVKNGDREDPFGAADQPLTRRFSKR